MQNEPQLTKAVEVFYSYSHNKEDEELKNGLLKQLAGIERQGVIVSWHDRKLTAGQEWAGQIDEHINTAGVILLLVSPDFMASGYCNDIELKRAMERHEVGEARVIPVIMRPTLWKGASFGKLQMLPTDARAVTLWLNRDEALLNVAEGILKAVEEIASQTAPAEGRQHPAANIPRPPVVGFVARRDEQGRDIVQLLSKELAPDKSQLIALWGPGGSGKTTLAAEFVRATAAVFQGRVAWVSALGRADFSLATLLDEVATRLGREDLRKLAPEPKAAEVAALVSNGPTLVVLDNFETISEEEQERCVDFLAQNAPCPVLITTRAFVDRDEVTNVELAAMELDEAREFLRRLIERTPKSQKFAHLDHDDLIRKCEANPLILQWVIRQIVLSKTPQTALDYLTKGEGDAAEHVFTRSFNLPQLGDDGRAVLLALSLFTPDASREALAEVSGFEGDLRRLNKALEKLSQLWFVETTEGNERLFLRGLTRGLAKSRMSGDGLADKFRQRYVAHFVRHADEHPEWTPQDFDALEAEMDNQLGAFDAAFEMRDWKSVTRIRYRMDGFLILRGYWDEAIRSGELAEAAAREANSEWNIAYFKTCVAEIWFNRGEYEKAEKVYRNALKIFRKLQSDVNIVRCLHYIGLAIQEQGDLKGAVRLYNESLRLAKKVGNKNHVASVTSQIGIALMAQGRLEESKAKHEASLALRRQLKDQPGIATDLHQLGKLAESRNDLAEARRLYCEALDINRRLGDKESIATSLNDLGLLTEKEGDRPEAARLFREALDILKWLRSHEAEKTRENLVRVESETD